MKKIAYLLICGIYFSIYSVEAQTNTFPASGNAGIGTLSPSAALEVKNADINVNSLTIGKGPGENFNSTVLGELALGVNVGGILNTAIGYRALGSNKFGNDNVALGQTALELNTNGSYNTALGRGALNNSLNGSNNVAVGYNALNNKNGSGNTAVGTQSLAANKKGSNNTSIGYQANVTEEELSNTSALGYLTVVDASNKVRIGNSSVTSIGGQVGWTIYSDAQIKNTVQENVPGLAFINLLRPVTYHYDVHKQNAFMGLAEDSLNYAGKYDIETMQFTGFIAQEVQASAKKINYDFSGVDNTGKLMGLRYSEFVVPLVKAVQELDSTDKSIEIRDERQENEIAELRIKNEELINNNIELEKRIEKLEAMFNTVSVSEISAKQVTLSGNTGARLEQNIPNPFTGNTTVGYYVPENVSSAIIKISNANGAEIRTVVLDKGNGILNIDALQLAAGNYTYILVVDGKVIDTKQMVLAK